MFFFGIHQKPASVRNPDSQCLKKPFDLADDVSQKVILWVTLKSSNLNKLRALAAMTCKIRLNRSGRKEAFGG